MYGHECHLDVNKLPEQLQRCTKCSAAVRPDTTLFGETVREYDRAVNVLSKCSSSTVLMIVGTSGMVPPADELPLLFNGGRIFEINISKTKFSTSKKLPGLTFIQGGACGTLQMILRRVKELMGHLDIIAEDSIAYSSDIDESTTSGDDNLQPTVILCSHSSPPSPRAYPTILGKRKRSKNRFLPLDRQDNNHMYPNKKFKR